MANGDNVIKAISIYGQNGWGDPVPIGVDADNVFLTINGEQKNLTEFSANITPDNYLLNNTDQTLNGNFTITGTASLGKGAIIKTTNTDKVIIQGSGNGSLDVTTDSNSSLIITPKAKLYFSGNENFNNNKKIPVGTTKSILFKQFYQTWHDNRDPQHWPSFNGNSNGGNQYFPLCGINGAANDSGVYLVTASMMLRSKKLKGKELTAYIAPCENLQGDPIEIPGTNPQKFFNADDRTSAAFSNQTFITRQNNQLQGNSGVYQQNMYDIHHGQRFRLDKTSEDAYNHINFSSIFYFKKQTPTDSRDFYLILYNDNDISYGYLTDAYNESEENNKNKNPINVRLTVTKLF